MNEISQQDLAKLTSDYQKLITSQQTLLLSTVSTAGSPCISYAPYIQDEQGIYYVYISDLAAHTQNLLNNRQASILFIRPEAESSNLFARERAAFSCTASVIAKNEENYTKQLQAMQDKFGSIIEVLRSLDDFHLIALTAEAGQYVIGFGRAYSINIADGTLTLITSK
jgi:heme oxygenase (biliverdin-IX-beta and delta-forming)